MYYCRVLIFLVKLAVGEAHRGLREDKGGSAYEAHTFGVVGSVGYGGDGSG